MYLIQMLLPLRDNEDLRFPRVLYEDVRLNLAERFGGATTYMRSPASGLWEDNGDLVSDEVVIFEVMTDRLEREYWRLYRLELQEAFRQDVILIRSLKVDVL